MCRHGQISRSLFFLLNVLLIFTGISCKKMFDIKPQSQVDQSQAYRNVYDADAAVIGIYGKVMKVAKQYVLWNELRGDLMDITFNSDPYLRQLSEQNVTSNNPYINPQPFYDVILNCNDALKNFKIMLQQNKLKTDEFAQRYSDIGAIRSWLYLQLGVHFGNIPYVTDPLAQVSDLHDSSKFPMIPLSQLIDSLVKFTETLPFLENYPSGTNLQTTVDGYPTSKFFINKNMLLGDLYLWQGQYNKAAVSFRKVMDINGPVGNDALWYNQYKISNNASNPATSSINYSRAQDFSSLNYGPVSWRNLFERPATDNDFNWEWIWVLPFDKNFPPADPFIDLFSINGGSYLVRPSQQAIDNWNSQTQVFTFTAGTSTAPVVFGDNFPFDSRGVFTYRYINGQPVIMKYLYNYLNASTAAADGLPLNVLVEQGKWFLARAATLHLHFAEAANRAGYPKVAYALVNRGIGFTYDPVPGGTTGRDVTNIQNTNFLPDPYKFDARNGDAPPYRNSWYRNFGIRGRANLKVVTLPATDSVTNVENMILDEDALELAYEGERWPDLLRIAIRRNDPAFIADKIYNKLIKSGLSAGAAGQARSKLMARDWFLPFKW
ncbi:MAG: RagB/SusD family nutrient uptake outer membrane protein [Bacteroidetes bacterium]|nr:MAG: RagB/SusD family nutrient uptake outer membrane protein [Bacteroidota bacterium]